MALCIRFSININLLKVTTKKAVRFEERKKAHNVVYGRVLKQKKRQAIVRNWINTWEPLSKKSLIFETWLHYLFAFKSWILLVHLCFNSVSENTTPKAL